MTLTINKEQLLIDLNNEVNKTIIEQQLIIKEDFEQLYNQDFNSLHLED